MEQNRTPLTQYSDRELLQLMVISLVELEKRNARLENYIAQKHGEDFHQFEPPDESDLRKTIIDYHDDAETEMESV